MKTTTIAEYVKQKNIEVLTPQAIGIKNLRIRETTGFTNAWLGKKTLLDAQVKYLPHIQNLETSTKGGRGIKPIYHFDVSAHESIMAYPQLDEPLTLSDIVFTKRTHVWDIADMLDVTDVTALRMLQNGGENLSYGDLLKLCNYWSLSPMDVKLPYDIQWM